MEQLRRELAAAQQLIQGLQLRLEALEARQADGHAPPQHEAASPPARTRQQEQQLQEPALPPSPPHQLSMPMPASRVVCNTVVMPVSSRAQSTSKAGVSSSRHAPRLACTG